MELSIIYHTVKQFFNLNRTLKSQNDSHTKHQGPINNNHKSKIFLNLKNIILILTTIVYDIPKLSLLSNLTKTSEPKR